MMLQSCLLLWKCSSMPHDTALQAQVNISVACNEHYCMHTAFRKSRIVTRQSWAAFLTAQCAHKDQPVRSVYGKCACNIWECRVCLWKLMLSQQSWLQQSRHMDLHLRCLADSNQLQISMMVATMRQAVLHAVLLISRTAGAWVLAAAPHTVAGHACLAALQAHA